MQTRRGKRVAIMPLLEIDGKNFYRALLAGSSRILENQQFMNKINVFPVPDGDTGTNLASTMRHIVEKTTPHISLKETASQAAAAALDGARGNSGIIFAQFLYGFSIIRKTTVRWIYTQGLLEGIFPHGNVEFFLAAKMVVYGRDITASQPADLGDRRISIPLFRKYSRRGL